MHQLVNEDVVANPLGHQHEAPVQTDVPVAAARTPSAPLIAYAHACDGKTVLRRKLHQPLRKYTLRNSPETKRFAYCDRGPRLAHLAMLANALTNPLGLSLCKRISLAARAAAWNRHANATIEVEPEHVPSRSPMTYVIDRGRRFLADFEWKAQLHSVLTEYRTQNSRDGVASILQFNPRGGGNMHSAVTRSACAFAVAASAAIAIACGGTDYGDRDINPPAATTPGESVGTSGTKDQLITVSGCVTKAQPDGFILTSSDEALLRRETGTAGHHRDDKDTKPSEPNRGAEDERLRHAQNPSAELGRYRLEGDPARIAMLANREVEVHGRVQRIDAENTTPATLKVETIDATGPRCGD